MASINLQGDTSGSISISAPSVAGSNTLTLPATTQTLATQNALGVRNIIINGDMRIAQRGTSVTGITSTGYRTVDRFRVSLFNGGTWTQTQDTDVPSGQGFATSLKMDCTTADTSLSANHHMIIQTALEGQNLQHLKYGTSDAESITLSFWVKSNKTGTYTVEFEQTGNARHYCKTFIIDSADTWEKKIITIDGDTSSSLANDNSAELRVNFYMVAGPDYQSGTLNTSGWASQTTGNRASSSNVNLADSTSNYINITGVQLEVGDTATPFEHRPYDMEMHRCQRYYEKSYNDGTAVGTASTGHSQGTQGSVGGVTTGAVGSYINFTVEKRTTPTIVTYDSAGNSGKVDRVQFGTATVSNFTSNVFEAGAKGFIAYSASGSKSAHSVRTHYTADSEL